ncbi:hypothetical protein RYJ27_13365 [Microbacterium limosum]|uniref:Uncharacterized protein n=1 Tax=Microbacterium limosum TaxID=3079935 RepID=A0AAU0MGN6_9MICO|nr:hypothetical protein [Microbacterium sp. Y20]WOQ69651.1 hypothetical protein RYJ27_13365 [Microbacterium sp. Y20]
MDVAETTGDGRWRRLALLCLGGAALGTALAFLIPAAAQADEGDDGSGLLGVVSQTVDAVEHTLGGVVGAADPAVTSVVETVAPSAPAPPAHDVAPAPPPPSPATAVGSVAHGLASTVDTAVGGVVETVGDAAASAPVAAVVEPADELVASAPVLSHLSSALGLPSALGALAASLDDTLAAVVGTPGADAGLAIPLPEALHPAPTRDAPWVNAPVGSLLNEPGPGDTAGNVALAPAAAVTPLASSASAPSLIAGSAASGPRHGAAAPTDPLFLAWSLMIAPASSGAAVGGAGFALVGALLGAVLIPAPRRGGRALRAPRRAPLPPTFATDVTPD